MTYDKNGNRLTIADPSAGNITNTWYGTGQPKTIADAKGQTTYTYSPDSKVLLQSYASPEGTTGYTYYTNGLVNTVTSPGGNLPVTRAYTYELGKVKTITETIDGLSNLVTFEYDTKGRLYRKYFNGTTEYEQYDYASNTGYLYLIQFVAAGINTIVWQETNMDDYKRITQANIGNTASTWSFNSSSNLLSQISATGVQGYTYSFDSNTGNLGTRTNSLKSKTETFDYGTDKLDRLASVTGPVNLSIVYTPDKNGNIQTKSDAGTFVYDATQPYAVDQITSGVNISADAQAITYYSFGKVKKITEGTGVTQKTADFDYNTDHQRIRMVLKTNGTATKTRYYFGSSCERELVAGVTTQYIWVGGDAYTAIAVAKKVGTGSWVIYNIFRDHLGTITHLKNGSTITEYSFDAWGRRRDKDDWTYTLTSEPALFADRGFTGHEYLEDFKLYNMNGRLYDPVVGRFLSADPIIQDPSFTQSFNRYSYCLNNPLKFTDPSGNTWWSKFWNWMNEHPTQVGFSTGGPNGPVYFASFGVNGNTNIGVGVNPQTGQVGVGNNSSGFYNFYFPGYNYDVAAQNFVNKTLPNVRAQYGDEWRAADGLGTTNNWLNGAGYLSGGIGAVQIGMLDYRSSLHLSSKIGTFSRFSSTYRTLGATSKVLGRTANWGGGPLTTYLDYRAMQSGEISSSRFAYRTTGTIGSIGGGYLIGLVAGNPWGAAGGVFIGAGFVAGEYIYDGTSYVWNETLRQISNFNKGIESGWYPGR